jgi:hypothetical protein
MRSLQRGDIVRRNRLFTTTGEVIEITNAKRDGVRLVRVRWAHPTTLPNPSLELEDSLDHQVRADARGQTGM